MKRNAMISAVALLAVLGTTLGASAAGFGGRDGQMGGKMGMGRGGPAFDFAAVDADEDGKITQEELDAYKDVMFSSMDADGNGTVDATELAAHQELQQKERLQTRAEAMIKARDTDGDGVLSAEEMAAGPQRVQTETSMIARFDTDGDGALSEAELEAAQNRTAQRGQMMEQRGGERGGHGQKQGRF